MRCVLRFSIIIPHKVVTDSLDAHLVAWQHLAYMSQQQGLRLYKLRPKHHYLYHVARDAQRTRLNALKLQACFNDESFLGFLKKIGVQCHASSMMNRLMQRYLLFLALRWRDAAHGAPAVWNNAEGLACLRATPDGRAGGACELHRVK